MNLELRIKGFLNRYKDIHYLDDGTTTGMLYQLFGWKMPEKVLQNYKATPDISDELQKHRSILGTEGVLDPDKCALENVLKYFVFLNRCYEKHELP